MNGKTVKIIYINDEWEGMHNGFVGELLSVKDDVYEVKTPLGTVKVSKKWGDNFEIINEKG